jgi:hypothetical protein
VWNLEKVLEGSVLGDPENTGLTLKEEIQQSGIGSFPKSVKVVFEIPNNGLKLYGGAAYERLLTEFVRALLHYWV